MKQVVEFLTLLHENNDKAWFDSHKEMYKRALSCFEVFTAKLIDKGFPNRTISRECGGNL